MVTDTNNAFPKLVCTGQDDPPLDGVAALITIVIIALAFAIFILCFLPLPLDKSPTILSHWWRK